MAWEEEVVIVNRNRNGKGEEKEKRRVSEEGEWLAVGPCSFSANLNIEGSLFPHGGQRRTCTSQVPAFQQNARVSVEIGMQLHKGTCLRAQRYGG